jgi:hypothetical protein
LSICVERTLQKVLDPTEQEVALHLMLVEQQHLESYAMTVDHAIKHKNIFDAKLRQQVPQNVVFQQGDLVQIHATKWV